MHKICKEKNPHTESEKRKKGGISRKLVCSENSTACFLQKNGLKKKCKTLTNREQERAEKEKIVMIGADCH